MLRCISYDASDVDHGYGKGIKCCISSELQDHAIGEMVLGVSIAFAAEYSFIKIPICYQ
jgi:hypothetical protein